MRSDKTHLVKSAKRWSAEYTGRYGVECTVDVIEHVGEHVVDCER